MSAALPLRSPHARPAPAPTRPKRTFFRLKSEWADWKAQQIEQAIQELQSNYIPSAKWGAIKNRCSVVDSMRQEAIGWRARANRYRAQGI